MGTKRTYRAHFRTWLRQNWDAPAQRERTARDMKNVSRHSLRRIGPAVLYLDRYGYDKRTGQFSSFEYALHLPLVSLHVNLSRPRLAPGVLSLSAPQFRLRTSTPSRPSVGLMLGTVHVWNYPYGSSREWGFSVGQISQKRFLFMVANAGESAPDQPRWSLGWLLWNRKAAW
ncbi:hypothetical protein BOO71_0000634 [Deinococcus marmoris]|uniref:Uncharacterized protein n=1 Tax=Deinococcus marmoris TaxID=249408 RepID=A0A1U7P4V5_9DEIO|nr:hypothetical protein BOO71_0000634 [Deinococcus marmoris]